MQINSLKKWKCRAVATFLCAVLLILPVCALQRESADYWLAANLPAGSGENTENAPTAAPTVGNGEASQTLDCRSAILMEASTGLVLFEQNPDESLPPASVTKVMTLLLVMEAIDGGKIALTDTITASAHAASMGGSQIYLKEGEAMTVEDLLKSVVISSANDAAVALAEYVSGSEEAFVDAMNRRAGELGMANTHFENTNGLDDTAANHVTSARDIALMSRELIKHRKILEYSSIWMDTIRNGAFGLTNTNRLVRFYRGCTGLKTGSTSKALFCVSVTAQREGMDLICVVMGAPSRDIRNQIAEKLLDLGYANYGVYQAQAESAGDVRVTGGLSDSVSLKAAGLSVVLPKEQIGKVTVEEQIPQTLAAPLQAGDIAGCRIYSVDGAEIGRVDITVEENVEKIGFLTLFVRIFGEFLLR